MLQIARIREDKAVVVEGLKKRNWSDEMLNLVDDVIAKDDVRKDVQTRLDELNAQSNKASKEIGGLYAQGKRDEAEELKGKMAELKLQIKELEEEHREVKNQVEELLIQLPNIPHSTVPAGKGEDDNEVFQAWDGEFPRLHDTAIPHWELAEKYNLFDMKLGAKITGSGFPLYRGQGAKLQRALINFFLDEATAAGYEEIIPPLMVNEDTARATGQLPDKEGQMYHITLENFYLIPTAEVPVTNIYRDVRVDADQFPIKLTGYTPCFRREAGSYGQDVKGLNRVHQFDKIEIVQIQHPDKSYDTLNEMLEHVGGLLQKLKLPYRILRLCGGDVSFASALTYDFEVYSAAQKRWLEVSSVSNFETFQSHRMNLKFKDESGKNQLAHTLNGSALALARVVAAILENNQTEDGIQIPEVLKPYTGFERIM